MQAPRTRRLRTPRLRTGLRLVAALALTLCLGAGCGDDDAPAGTDAGMDAGGPACTPSGFWCDPGESCDRGGRCDGPGTCVPVPDPCPTPGPDDQVCGCDGAFYPSECTARAAGVDVYFDDEPCTTPAE
ncbi:MAG: hypothetical protein CMN31_13720 [Sandaracinus sp.]|nr:hypothetical protein [Myxococcales bacterium]MBJ72373.1 hypothetical protein [Sandaracinus sp.]